MRVTVIKYIHKWLSTTRRSFIKGKSLDQLCPLCYEPENQTHIFCCTDEAMKKKCEERWMTCLSALKRISPPERFAVAMSGLRTVMGKEHPTKKTIRDWPLHLQERYHSQARIGWTHMFYGRIAKCWDHYLTGDGDTSKIDNTGWIYKVIVLLWNFGLDLWKLRNILVHGEGPILAISEERAR